MHWLQQIKIRPSPHLSNNENDSASTTKEEEKLKNAVLLDQMKCLAEKFKSASLDKDECLEEACVNGVFNEEVMPIAKPNWDDERVQKHADKLNKNIEMNKKSSNQLIGMC